METLTTMLKRGESLTVEFKESFQEEALQTIGTFANTQGGAATQKALMTIGEKEISIDAWNGLLLESESNMTDRNLTSNFTRNIERALNPGEFIRYGEMSEFIKDLEKVQEKLAALVDDGQAAQAVRLYEVFLSGCYEKMEECDDSGGNMGMFWDELFCGRVKARQKAGYPAAETVEQILKWQENDDYGLCFEIEKKVVKVLDREGYHLFSTHFQAAVEQALAKLGTDRTRPIFEYKNDIRLPAMSLKRIYQVKGDVTSYAELCERLGLSPKDCEHLAEMEMAKAHWDKALAWVEKGVALEPTRSWCNIHAAEHSALESVSHYHAEPAADGLAKRDITVAAKLYRALGMRILISKKSKYYDHALRHLRKARDLYQKAGLDSEWQTVIKTVREEHSKKYSFTPGFEQIVAGASAERPSFADKARNRWKKQIS